MKSHHKTLIKFAFVFVIFYLMAKKGYVSFEETQSALKNTSAIAAGFACFAVSEWMAILRWNFLLKTQDVSLPLRRVLRFGIIGLFFNAALPGVISGDVVKAIYVGRESPGKRAYIFGSILFDRAMGLSGLVLIAAASLAFYLNFIDPHATFYFLKNTIYVTASGVILFYLYLFFAPHERDPILRRLKLLEIRYPKTKSLRRTYESILTYSQKRKAVLLALLMSVLIHLSVTYGYYCLYQAFDENQLSWTEICLAVPFGLVVSAIPVLPMGIGTGHYAFKELFSVLGSLRGADIFNLFLLSRLMFGALAGLYYLRFRSPTAVTDAEIQQLAQE